MQRETGCCCRDCPRPLDSPRGRWWGPEGGKFEKIRPSWLRSGGVYGREGCARLIRDIAGSLSVADVEERKAIRPPMATRCFFKCFTEAAANDALLAEDLYLHIPQLRGAFELLL